MFVKAIDNAKQFVKPFVTSYKTPYSDDLINTMYSVILINEEGWALTTKSIANNILYADKIHKTYELVREELIKNKVPPKKIYKKYKLDKDSPVILKNVFLDTVTSWNGLKVYMHESLDLALIKFEGAEGIFCKKFPVFKKELPKQGESLCRLGYPYQDAEIFRYDHRSKDLVINELIDASFQIMPMEGMLTRYLKDKDVVSMFELSGSSFINHIGGPIINKDGEVVGIEIENAYKDALQDIDAKLKRSNTEYSVKQYNFIPFSICINAIEIMKFMDKYDIKYKTK